MVTKQSLQAVQRDEVFRAVADPTRRAILDRLRQGPANVNSIAAAFDQTRPGISKHLRVLRECHLVRETRAGRERVYELSPEPIEQISHWAAQYQAFWKDSLDALKTYLESEP
jgi:DNA-binding transcriptional ArsR family regulator